MKYKSNKQLRTIKQMFNQNTNNMTNNITHKLQDINMFFKRANLNNPTAAVAAIAIVGMTVIGKMNMK